MCTSYLKDSLMCAVLSTILGQKYYNIIMPKPVKRVSQAFSVEQSNFSGEFDHLMKASHHHIALRHPFMIWTLVHSLNTVTLQQYCRQPCWSCHVWQRRVI